jgi:hypothetical protein
MRIPNLLSWNRRLRIQGAADIVECGQGILLVAHLAIHESLELRQHHVDLAVELGNEGTVGIARSVVLGLAA